MKAGAAGRWLVIYIAHSLVLKDYVQQTLEGEGFLVRCRVLSRKLSGSDVYEVCVLESEAHEARRLIFEMGL